MTPVRKQMPSTRSSPDLPALLERKARRRRRRLITVQTLLLVLITLVWAYQTDVRANLEKREAAEISVNVHGEPADPAHDSSAVVFFDGFGTYDADHLSDTLAAGYKEILDGETWSVSYGNAPLASERIGELILDLAHERGVTDLALVGYSMGGIIDLEVAAYLAGSPEVTVRNITLVSTPDGLDGLRPHQKKELEFAQTFARVPGAQYSTFLRFIGEVYFMRDRYSDGDLGTRASNFVEVLGIAKDYVGRPRLPGTWLLVDQAFAIANADLDGALRTIAEESRMVEPLPTVLYLGTAPPGRDYMVNDEVSSKRICRYAALYGISCEIRDVPGAVHTMPERTADAYRATFGELRPSAQLDMEQAELMHELRTGGDGEGLRSLEQLGFEPPEISEGEIPGEVQEGASGALDPERAEHAEAGS
ncbi:alpha/beta hydrolase [Leucobacter sp. CSA1]|uniref:Alpha/beta hydrolase n=1 Tax=Leucobacter chromiisoli TaxID=2796471 RepID=A0A934Q6F5_9MICO|nr:alpha/beta hydrolase [Leucobacter chromiisoli]MBK0417702.1 alpha/beta hydrolase [Leucobacter chromiisoli]